jgi:hypothetical protein
MRVFDHGHFRHCRYKHNRIQAAADVLKKTELRLWEIHPVMKITISDWKHGRRHY